MRSSPAVVRVVRESSLDSWNGRSSQELFTAPTALGEQVSAFPYVFHPDFHELPLSLFKFKEIAMQYPSTGCPPPPPPGLQKSDLFSFQLLGILSLTTKLGGSMEGGNFSGGHHRGKGGMHLPWLELVRGTVEASSTGEVSLS